MKLELEDFKTVPQNLEINNIEVEVTAHISKFYPETYGQPAEGGEVEDLSVKYDGIELWEYLKDTTIERLEEQLLEELNVEPDEE